MSTTRIVFIIVCVVAAACVFTLGLIIQKNGGGGLPPLSSLFSARGENKNKPRLLKNPSSALTIVLVIALFVLYLVFSKK